MSINNTPINNMSRFLKNLRLKRGFRKIDEYLKKYPDLKAAEPKPSISDRTYKEIEASRHPITRFNTANKIKTSLKLNEEESLAFYKAFLHDNLIEDIYNNLVAPNEEMKKLKGELAQFKEMIERDHLLDKSKEDREQIDQLKKVVSRNRITLSSEAANYYIELLDNNPKWDDVLMWIMLKNRTISFDEVKEFCIKIDIKNEIESTLNELSTTGIVEVDNENKTVRMTAGWLILPDNSKGTEARIKSLSKLIENIDPEQTVRKDVDLQHTTLYRTWFVLPEKEQHVFKKKIEELLLLIEQNNHRVDDDPDSLSLVFGLVLIPKPYYHLKHEL